jgi:tRNA pseudouridine55 synthase
VTGSFDGILIADKPEAMSSAHLVARVKRWGRLGKIGHAGTLDPFATGVMVLLINRATRLADFFLNGEKRYRATLRLGVGTDTQDATGTVIEQAPIPHEINEDMVLRVMGNFIGEQLQQPPAYSALKHHGVPLYKLARQGKPVLKPPRRILIHALDLERVVLPDIFFTVQCSSGTYVRTLAVDLAKALSSCGHLAALRRTGSGGFEVQDSLELEEIRVLAEKDELWKRFIPMDAALKDLRGWVADQALTEKLKYGRILFPADLRIPEESGTDRQIPGSVVKILDDNRALLAVLRFNTPDEPLQYVVNFMTR